MTRGATSSAWETLSLDLHCNETLRVSKFLPVMFLKGPEDRNGLMQNFVGLHLSHKVGESVGSMIEHRPPS